MDNIPYKLYPLIPITPTWADLENQINETDLSDSSLKDLWKEALRFLRVELGNGFFNTCGVNHPLCRKLCGLGEGQIKELIEWTNTLKILKECDSNYSILLQKLTNRLKCKSEGIPFLEVAKSYIQNGFHVKFLPELVKTRTPDLEIIGESKEDNFFIEISRINDTKERSIISRQYNQISNAVLTIGFDLPHSIKQYLILTDKQLQTVWIKIQQLKDEAWSEQKLAFWQIDEISMAFVHPLKYDDLLAWSKENNQQTGFNGPTIEFNDTSRIIRQQKFRKEAGHIPLNSTGILYFPSQILYFYTMNKIETIQSFQNDLEKFPHIYGAVLYAEIIEPEHEPVLIDNMHIYLEKRTVSGSTPHLLFVQNPAYTGALSKESFQKIRAAIINM